MDEMTPIYQKKDLPLGSSTTCRLESLEPREEIDRRDGVCGREGVEKSDRRERDVSQLSEIEMERRKR